MDTLTLPARLRTAVGKKANSVRRMKSIPAVLYGHGITNQNLEIDGIAFQKVFRQAGSSSLVDLVIDSQSPIRVLIHDIQRHPTLTSVIHVDLYQVKMTEKLETDIDLHIVGESPAVKEHGGILVRVIDKVKVSCLPADLVPAISVDISQLKNFDDRIAIKDLTIPKGITILDDAETVVTTVTRPRTDAELEALNAAVTEDVAAVEKVEAPKADADDDGAADEAPAKNKESKKDT